MKILEKSDIKEDRHEYSMKRSVADPVEVAETRQRWGLVEQPKPEKKEKPEKKQQKDQSDQEQSDKEKKEQSDKEQTDKENKEPSDNANAN